MIKADANPLLYIVIAVIAMIVSAVNKSKKKVAQPSQSSPENGGHPKPQPSWQKELENIFGKVLEEKPEVVVEKPKVHETIVAEASAKKQQQAGIKTKEVTLSANPVNEFKAQEETSLSQLYETNEHEGKYIDLEHIELEKAVIYSEIMNRKYF